jgi:transcriptional regulator with XRE-family HTH domain
MLLDARKRKGMSQAELASNATDLANLSGPRISAFEKGQARPSIFQLAKLSLALEIDFQAAILARLRDELDEESRSHGEALWSKGEAEETFRRFDQLMDWSTSQGIQKTDLLRDRSLERFPHSFPNLVIVTGDKREEPPKSAGDIGAYSASPIDDRWIHLLHLPPGTEKVSDKEFVISTNERLVREYGDKTLLIIGSPASNHLARITNRWAVFPFNLPKDHRILQELIEDLRDEKDRAILEARKRDNQVTLKRIMRAFFAYGIIDPIRRDVAGFAIPHDKDYATISLARNPFAPHGDYAHLAILVAGFHHPGTAVAVRWLGEASNFEQHPYGGVVEISIDDNKPWAERTRRGTRGKWETAGYDREEVLAGLKETKQRRSALLSIESEDIDQVIRMIENL